MVTTGLRISVSTLGATARGATARTAGASARAAMLIWDAAPFSKTMSMVMSAVAEEKESRRLLTLLLPLPLQHQVLVDTELRDLQCLVRADGAL